MGSYVKDVSMVVLELVYRLDTGMLSPQVRLANKMKKQCPLFMAQRGVSNNNKIGASNKRQRT